MTAGMRAARISVRPGGLAAALFFRHQYGADMPANGRSGQSR